MPARSVLKRMRLYKSAEPLGAGAEDGGLTVGVEVGVSVRVGVGDDVAVGDSVGVGVGVHVDVAVGLGVEVWVLVGNGVLVGVLVGVEIGGGAGVLEDTRATAVCVAATIACAVDVASRSRFWSLYCPSANAPANPISSKRAIAPTMTRGRRQRGGLGGSRATVLLTDGSSISSVGM
jgi:hypothetical protein